VFDHNHEIGPQHYSSYSFTKKLTEADIDLVLLLHSAKAPPRKIADALSKSTGDNYTAKDVQNLLAKTNKKENGETLEKHLDEVRKDGGTVRVKKDEETGYVTVLWIQTKEMKEMLARVKPTVFQNDTTFGTNSEGYKLFIPVYHNTVIDKSDFAGLLFLATETRENIETGLDFFKDSVDYTTLRRFIFFVDKDFDYIDVLDTTFPGCHVFLCSVHVYRYWREKVLPSSKMSTRDMVDKVEIINLLKLLRDSPTEEIYEEIKDQVFELTEDLLVKPGNTKDFVPFHRYFTKNWHDCRQMWAFCYRKNHPTMVSFMKVSTSTSYYYYNIGNCMYVCLSVCVCNHFFDPIFSCDHAAL
jgi:hypothetical protein